MTRDRRSGVLLHPTSLPGEWGIGDFGPAATALLDWLADAGQTLWQVLPLGPPGPGDSPYSACSAFAGSATLISPRLLVDGDLLPPGALDLRPDFPPDGVDYATVRNWKEALLRVAWQHATRSAAHRALVDEARALGEAPGYAAWLPDWALYSALKRRFDGQPWPSWPQTYRLREGATLEVARRELEEEIHFQQFCQLLWFRQWSGLRAAARARGIRILGDLPIYVALDSADVWAHREIFDLDDDGRPNAVAGVPPDAFSDSGQLWGHPLYRWDRLSATGFEWWIERLRASLRIADVVRIDHFRGFAASWRIPPKAASARDGAWGAGPGIAFFTAVRAALGHLPMIAEDLGEITPDVRKLRREAQIPGTRVLQFAFDDPASEHAPHNLAGDTCLYTGTHDNPTTAAWFDGLDAAAQGRVLAYTGGVRDEIHWALIRTALVSVAATTVFPMQDVLGLGPEARMNDPAAAEGSWRWRLDRLPGAATAARLRRLTELAGRLGGSGPRPGSKP